MRANWILVGLALGVGVGIGLLARPARQGQELATAGAEQRSMSPVRTKSSSRFASTASSPSSRDKVANRSSIEGEARRLSVTPDPQDSADALELYTAWAQNDPYSAITQAIDLGEAGGHLRHRVMQVWARQNPAAAAEFFSSHRSSFVQLVPQNGALDRLGAPSAVAQAIAKEWAAIDPKSAQAWAITLPSEDYALKTVISTLAGQSPSLAIGALSTIIPKDQTSYLNEIAKSWAVKDYSEARIWINQLPPEQRDQALISALAGLAESDPMRAAKELVSQVPSDEQQRLAGSLARTWSQHDPYAVADWLRQPGNETIRYAAAGPAIEALARRDSEAAWKLVQAMDGSDAYDPALAAYIKTQSAESPEKLLDLSNSIRDEASRGQAIALIMSRWSAIDPQAAASFQERGFSR